MSLRSEASRRATRAAVAVGVTLALAACTTTQPQDSVARARVTGSVTRGTSGAPVAGVRVSIAVFRDTACTVPAAAAPAFFPDPVTDANGRFDTLVGLVMTQSFRGCVMVSHAGAVAAGPASFDSGPSLAPTVQLALQLP